MKTAKLGNIKWFHLIHLKERADLSVQTIKFRHQLTGSGIVQHFPNAFVRMLNAVFMLSILIAQASYGQDKTLYSGTWNADSYFTTFEGSWSIVIKEGKTFIVFGNDFVTKKAPDLKIFVSGLRLDDINSNNAADPKSAVFIANLNSYKGVTAYEIPAHINLADYKTILVHCQAYAKFWGGSPLK